MKIIKTAWEDRYYPTEHTCSVCGCVYEYDEDDIHATEKRDGICFGVVFCPECNSSHHVTCSENVWDNAWNAMIAREYRLALMALAAKNEEEKND